MQRINALRSPALAVLLALAATASRARAGDEGAVEYPKEWGPSLAAADHGGKIVETSSNATPAETLIDGSIAENHAWQPDLGKGFPASLTIALGHAERVGRVHLTHRADGPAPPRDIEVWLGRTRELMKLAVLVTLPNARAQTIDLETQETAFVRLVVRSSHSDGELEIGEVGVFAAPLAAIRGSDTKDVVEPVAGDRLLGELATEEVTLHGRLGQHVVKVQDLIALSLEDPRDGLDRAFLRSGEVIVGEMVTPSIKLKLDGGSVVEIPKSKLRGIGARRGQGEFPERPEALLAKGHVLLLAGGGRAVGKLALDEIVLHGPSGDVRLPLKEIQAIDVGQRGEALDRVALRSGDVLRGFVALAEVPFIPSGAQEAASGAAEAGLAGANGPPRVLPLKLSKAVVVRLLLAAEPDPETAGEGQGQRLHLRTGEIISGTLAVEKLKIRTGYATVELDPAAFESITASEGGRLRVVLRDGGVIQGRPEHDPLPLDLDAGGGRLLVPVERLERIENHRLPPEVSKRIEELLKKLDGEWAEREAAQAELVKVGRAALPRLARAAREGSPEVKARAQAALAQIRPALEAEPRPPGPRAVRAP